MISKLSFSDFFNILFNYCQKDLIWTFFAKLSFSLLSKMVQVKNESCFLIFIKKYDLISYWSKKFTFDPSQILIIFLLIIYVIINLFWRVK